MKHLMIVISLVGLSLTTAAKSSKVHKGPGETGLVELLQRYSKKHGEQIIVDPGVRGRVHLFLKDSMTKEESLNVLSHALTLNGYTLVRKGDYWIVRSSRNAQRDQIPVYSNTLPPAQPEMIVTYIRDLKKASADKIFKEVRLFASKDGEMSVYSDANRLLISDYSSNIIRIEQLLLQLDR